MKRGAKGDTYYGRIAENYEQRRSKQGWWAVEQREMETLLEKLPKGLKVLDVPFGTGRFVPYYLENGYSIYGIDASDEMLAAAEKSLGKHFENCVVATGNAMALNFETDEFDLLVSTRFLRDIVVARDAKKALSEFARVTKKYAIIQLGECIEGDSASVDDNFVLGSRLSASDNEAMLDAVGLRVLDKRLVKKDKNDNSNIFHVLCEKVASR